VDGTGSGSCPMVGFYISGVEPSDSVTRVLILHARTPSALFQDLEVSALKEGRVNTNADEMRMARGICSKRKEKSRICNKQYMKYGMKNSVKKLILL
jgi:hypothetical protein